MENINELVSKLKKPDIYSLICGFLFELKEDPKYSTLCELAYLLDIESLLNLMKYYEGQEIKIPTRREFKDCIQLLLLFQYFEVEKKDWKESLELSGFNSGNAYCSISNVILLRIHHYQYLYFLHQHRIVFLGY